MEANTRTFVVDKVLFGNLVKPNNLGLKSFSPYIRLDNNETRGYFGKDAEKKVADAASGTTLEGTKVSLPLDVKLTGYQYLTQLGVPPSEQEAAMLKWLALPSQVQEALISQWEALNKSDAAAVSAFVMGVMAQLGA